MSVALDSVAGPRSDVPLDELVAEVRELVVSGRERVIQVPLDDADPLGALSWVPDDAVYWCAPSGLRTVGFGVSARLVASGRGRFHEIGVAAQALFDRLDTSACTTPVRLHVGCAFGDRIGPDGRWAGFAAADALLPAVTVQETPTGWVLRVAVTQRTVFPVLAGQLRRVLRGVASAPAAHGRLPDEARYAGAGNYRDLVRDIVRRIESGQAQKIVAARRTDVSVDRAVRDADAVDRLDRAYPGCFRFMFRRGESTFVGASPEPLVRLSGRSVDTVALAGSASATVEGEVALRASAKDAAEHAHVVEHIRHALGPFCRALEVGAEPRIRRLRHIVHLETPVSGELREPVHVLRLVAALHPTPAVGGVPAETALAWIERCEEADRGWYSGPVGWFDSEGDGELAVAIRSGLVRGSSASIWAGAGIVDGSDAELEDAETQQKLRPLLHALGIED